MRLSASVPSKIRAYNIVCMAIFCTADEGQTTDGLASIEASYFYSINVKQTSGIVESDRGFDNSFQRLMKLQINALCIRVPSTVCM